MYVPKINTARMEHVLLMKPGGDYLAEVEGMRIICAGYDRPVQGSRVGGKQWQPLRVLNVFIASSIERIEVPSCCVDKLEYGRKLNNTGVKLCLV